MSYSYIPTSTSLMVGNFLNTPKKIQQQQNAGQTIT